MGYYYNLQILSIQILKVNSNMIMNFLHHIFYLFMFIDIDFHKQKGGEIQEGYRRGVIQKRKYRGYQHIQNGGVQSIGIGTEYTTWREGIQIRLKFLFLSSMPKGEIVQKIVG